MKRALENKIPPPVVTALVAVAMWVGAKAVPEPQIDSNLRLVLAVAFLLSGLVVTGLGAVAFRRAKTTINPLNPEQASSIVTGSVYRFTRNPMYVGFASVLVGWAAYLAVPWALLGPVVFTLFITRFQIIPEERVLSAKFGQEYSEYRMRVRRWL